MQENLEKAFGLLVDRGNGKIKANVLSIETLSDTVKVGRIYVATEPSESQADSSHTRFVPTSTALL